MEKRRARRDTSKRKQVATVYVPYIYIIEIDIIYYRGNIYYYAELSVCSLYVPNVSIIFKIGREKIENIANSGGAFLESDTRMIR